MTELVGKVFEALAPWPWLQMLVAVGIVVGGIWAWRTGDPNRRKASAIVADDDAGEHRRRIYSHMDEVEDKLRLEFSRGDDALDARLRAAEQEIAVLKAATRAHVRGA